MTDSLTGAISRFRGRTRLGSGLGWRVRKKSNKDCAIRVIARVRIEVSFMPVRLSRY